MSYYNGKIALITGASSGIGEEFAKQLHQQGANVILVARRKDRLQALTEEFNMKRANSAEALALDLTDFNSDLGLKALSAVIEERVIDVFVSNAGVGSFGKIEEIDLDYELNIINLNILAPTLILRRVIKQMKKRRKGDIVILSSVAGFQPLPYMATYAASKAFNLFQSLAIRQEVKDDGIKVLAVCPGPTQTEFFGVAKVAGQMTNIRRDKVQNVVKESLTALLYNKPYVVTGWRSKIMAWASRLAPFQFGTWAVKRALQGSLGR